MIGHTNASSQLAVPLAQWLGCFGLEALLDIFRPLLAGYGYGYAEEVSASYALRVLSPANVFSCCMPVGRSILPQGYQNFCDALARDVDVRLNSPVTAIRRLQRLDDDVVEIATGASCEAFDAVILTSPLDDLAHIMDCSDAERTLFRAIEYCTYHSVAVEVFDLPISALFIHEHLDRRAGEGRLVFSYTRYADSPLTILYAQADAQTSDDLIIERLREDVTRLGGRMGDVVAHERWRYFPHVSPATFAAGFYDKLEALQGDGGVYFAGEVMSFSSVEAVCRYSCELTERYF